jgi:leucyl-tRNA synthetase
LADAGDGLEDANFLDKTADDAILKLYTEREFIEEALKETTRVGEYSWNDRVFDTEINNLITLCQQSYEKMLYREVLKIGFYDLQNARNDYRKATTGQGLSHILPDEKFEGMHLDLVKKFARIQALLLLPITPHWSEHIWKDLLHEKDTVMNARFPVAEKIDDSLIAAATYIRALGSKIRSAEDTANKKKSKKGKVVQGLNDPKILTLNIASHFPQWQEEVIEIVKQSYHESQNIFDGKETENLKNAGLLKDKRIMPFVAMLKVTKN